MTRKCNAFHDSGSVGTSKCIAFHDSGPGGTPKCIAFHDSGIQKWRLAMHFAVPTLRERLQALHFTILGLPEGGAGGGSRDGLTSSPAARLPPEQAGRLLDMVGSRRIR